MRVLVTGADGFVGRRLVRRPLAEAGPFATVFGAIDQRVVAAPSPANG